MNATVLSLELKALAATALSHQNANRFAEAAQAYAALLSRAPQSWAACYNLGLVYQHLQRLPEAADMYARAVRLNPKLAEGYNNLGNVLKTLKNTEAAVEAYQQALTLNPQLSEASYNLATMLQARGDTEASIGALRQALAVNPAHGNAWDALYRALLGLARQEEAIQAFLDWEKSAELSTEMVVAGLALCRPMGDRKREARYLKLAIEWPFAAFAPEQYAPVLGMIQYFDISREELLACYRRYDQATVAQRPLLLPYLSRRSADARLRIGYVSGDFRQHVMGRIMLDVISRHDRGRFSVLLISTCPRSQHDSITAAFRRCADGFADISELDDAVAARSIADADIDVLIDLAGHTNTARPGIYAHRPARSIVTHLGYHGCLGLGVVDFKLTDRVADLPDAADYQIERPYVLDHCLFPFVRVGPTPVEHGLGDNLNLAGRFVLGAFVNVLKLSPRCLSVWRRVLDTLPEAVLLFSPLSAGEHQAIERVTAAAGIASSRIAILNVSKRDESSLRARYRLVSAVLDTFPYAGGDTTLAALDMGVPVVTLVVDGQSQRQSERIGASILIHLGLDELVAKTDDAFIDIVTRLARQPDFIATMREKISVASAGAAANAEAYTRTLEAAFVDIAAQKPVEASMNLTAHQFFQTLQDAMRRQHVAADDEERRAIATLLAELRSEQPDYPPLLRAQCDLAQSLDDLPLAIDCLSVLIRQHPDDIDARLALAGFLIDRQSASEALKVLDDAFAAGGNTTRILNLRTRAHGQLRQWETARQYSAAAIELNPADSQLLFWHGTVLSHLGEFDDALNFLNRALVLSPHHAEAAYNAGVLLAELGNHADAEKVFRRALGTPAAALAHRRLLHTLKTGRRRAEWLLEADRFVRTYPGQEYTRLIESRIARYRGDINREVEILLPLAEQATMIENDVTAAEVIGELLAILPYHDVSQQLLILLSERYRKALTNLHPPLDPSHTTQPPPDRRLHLGYLVDFSLLFVADLMLGLAASRNRDRHDTTVYVLSPASSSPMLQEQLEAAGVNVVFLTAFDDHRAAERIRVGQIDVLIDVAGFGTYAKPGLLSHRPAALQLAFPGFSRPTSAGEFAYRLSDDEMDLASAAIPASWPVEGGVFPIFPAILSQPAITRASLGINSDVPVFGVLASVDKLSLRAVGLWKSLSDRLPEALFFLCPLDPDDVVPMHKILSAAGLDATRIRSLSSSIERPRDLALAGVVDVILDTLPGSDYFSVRAALCEGIPIVTTPGRTADERVALTILGHLGERSTIAESGRDYVDMAVRLAGNPEFRRSWTTRVSALWNTASRDITPSSMQTYAQRHGNAIQRAVEAQRKPPPM